MMNTYFVNGHYVPANAATIGVEDLGLLRAYGIFDFFRAVNGIPIFLEDHLDRFERSATLMGLAIPESREKLREIVYQLIQKNNVPLLGIKMVLTGGYSNDGFTPAEKANFFVIAKSFQFSDPSKGMKLITVNHQRQVHEVKSLDYLLPIYVRKKVADNQADDVLYHHNGNITESSRSNIFIVKNGVVITPDTGMLAGVTRKKIISIAQRTGFSVEERPVSLQETLDADEVFTTGSTKRVVSIVQIDDTLVNVGERGEITKKLYQLLLENEA